MDLMDILSALNYAGETIDKPGRALRGVLAGKTGELANLIPFSDAMGITDPAQSISGRDMLESWGAIDPNQEGLDAGDIAGFGAEMLLDPLNLIPGIGAAKALGKASKARAANRSVDAASGYVNAFNDAQDAARLHNLDVDMAKNAQGDALDALHSQYFHTPTFVDPDHPNFISPIENVSKHRDRLINSSAMQGQPPPTDQDIMKILHGTFDEVGETYPKMLGLKKAEMPEDIDRMSRHIGYGTHYIDTAGSSIGGFVSRLRPDMTFVGPTNTANRQGTQLHEWLHIMRNQFPDEYQQFIAAVGNDPLMAGGEMYFGRGGRDPLRALAAQTSNPDYYKEEGAATVIDHMAKKIGSGDGTPWMKLATSAETPEIVSELGSAINEGAKYLGNQIGHGPNPIKDPAVAGRIFADLITGKMKRRRSLVPVSGVESGFTPPKSFVDYGDSSPLDALEVDYTPVQEYKTIPTYEDVPSIMPYAKGAAVYNPLAQLMRSFDQ